MALRINDGYTIAGKTTGQDFAGGNTLPVVSFDYRPPTAARMAQYRRELGAAKTGEEEVKARAAFVAERLVSWDVEGPDGKPLPPTAESVAMLPDEIMLDLAAEVVKWKPMPQGDAAKNSHPA